MTSTIREQANYVFKALNDGQFQITKNRFGHEGLIVSRVQMIELSKGHLVSFE
ncbi:hypothetical protein ACI2JA_03590 [Alkalihalobacillus sp. NPDC078783]